MSRGRLVKKSITRKDSGAIPPTQLVDRSYSTYKRHGADFPNPTNAVGGSLISNMVLISWKANPSGGLGWV
jgi:hypothetical protein